MHDQMEPVYEFAESHDIATPPSLSHKPTIGNVILSLRDRGACVERARPAGVTVAAVGVARAGSTEGGRAWSRAV